LTNTATKRQGSLCIVDLGHPRFSPATDSQNSIYRSFENLRMCIESLACKRLDELIYFLISVRLIDAVVKTSDNKTSSEAVITDYYLLTDVLAKFICGQGYMVVCAHLQVKYYRKMDINSID
jgi:hypothetical protein